MRTILVLITLVAAVAFAGYGAWYVPSIHPDVLELGQLQKSRGIQPLQLEAECSRDPDVELCKATYIREHKDYLPSREETLFLGVSHAIPDEDCLLMAKVLREEAQVENDGELIKNADGGMNCDFARFGLKHITYPERAGGYEFYDPFGNYRNTSRLAYEYITRTRYVTRPVYSLFHMRMRIEYGGAGSGSYCYFNRFRGEWRRDGECGMAWES